MINQLKLTMTFLVLSLFSIVPANVNKLTGAISKNTQFNHQSRLFLDFPTIN